VVRATIAGVQTVALQTLRAGAPRRAWTRASEPALVRAAQRGSAEAFAELFRRHWPRAHRAAWLVVHDAAAAEDIAQEAFLRLLHEVGDRRTPDNVRAWLYRVASNLVISRGRRQTVAVRWLSALGRQEVTHESPERVTIGRESHEGLQVALASLPRDTRVALLMAAQGFSGQEIAAAVGRSEAATRTMLCRARLQLRERLDPPDAGR
jgi:RNA polymerase sigma-70 factor (ECF subfamily)